MSAQEAIDLLDAQLRKVQALSKSLPKLAQVGARKLDTILRANIAAGRAPDGTPWQLTQTGKVPLQNAGQALSVAASGTSIVATLTGPEALHHRGIAAGGIARPILPTRDIPTPVTAALQQALVAVYEAS